MTSTSKDDERQYKYQHHRNLKGDGGDKSDERQQQPRQAIIPTSPNPNSVAKLFLDSYRSYKIPLKSIEHETHS